AAVPARAQPLPAARLERLAQAYVDASAADDPFLATAWGRAGHDGALPAATEAQRSRRIARLHA
ncbi:MAG: hypothetical protein KGL18_14315, partial [Burkholderiales bacterium]|nr:hypothetical protein [Burkholderiales bacterium]